VVRAAVGIASAGLWGLQGGAQQPADLGDHPEGTHSSRKLLGVHRPPGAVVEGIDLLGLVASAIGDQLLHHPLAGDRQVAADRLDVAHPPVLGCFFPHPRQWQPLSDPQLGLGDALFHLHLSGPGAVLLAALGARWIALAHRPGGIEGLHRPEGLAIGVLMGWGAAQLLNRIYRRRLRCTGVPVRGRGGGACDQGERVLNRSGAGPQQGPAIQDFRERSSVAAGSARLARPVSPLPVSGGKGPAPAMRLTPDPRSDAHLTLAVRARIPARQRLWAALYYYNTFLYRNIYR